MVLTLYDRVHQITQNFFESLPLSLQFVYMCEYKEEVYQFFIFEAVI